MFYLKYICIKYLFTDSISDNSFKKKAVYMTCMMDAACVAIDVNHKNIQKSHPIFVNMRMILGQIYEH